MGGEGEGEGEPGHGHPHTQPAQHQHSKEELENGAVIAGEVCLPYLCAGLGMVGAGIVLDRVQYWPVFVQIPELFIMVPALIGLKGNLEMTLASRLSTHANLGHLDTIEQTVDMGTANLALIQLQGIVVGGLAAIIAAIMAALSSTSHLQMEKFLVMMSSSVVTASLASLSLGIVMILVIAVSRKFKVNPDNVATPIAAALGDLVTLALLSLVATGLAAAPTWPPALLAIYATIAYSSLRKASDHAATRDILVNGWTPVLSAMLISSLGGAILNRALARYPGIAAFQPVINGVAGNLVGIQASRLSTSLHQTARLGRLPPGPPPCSPLSPLATFLAAPGCQEPVRLTNNRTAAIVLLLLVVPGHLVFNLAIGASQGFHVLSFSFLLLYMLAALLQVGLLLHMANVMVHRMWSLAIDPDNSAIPYLTALGDLMGGILLATVFLLIG